MEPNGSTTPSEEATAPESTPVMTERRPRRKKGKIDEVLKILSHVHETLVDTSHLSKLTNEVKAEIRVLAQHSHPTHRILMFLEKQFELTEHLFECLVNTNGFTVAIHGELTKMNASLVELNHAVRTLKVGGPVGNGPATQLPLAATPSGPPPPPHYYPYTSVPPGGPPTPGYQSWAPPAAKPESIVGLLVDLKDKDIYALARDFGLFERNGDADFMRLDGLRQAQWLAERVPNPSAAIPVIKEKVEKYRQFREEGYKNRKL